MANASALAGNIKRPVTAAEQFHDPAAAGVHVFVGALVVLDSSGNAKPAVEATGLVARGVCYRECDNSTGDAGDLKVFSRAGVFEFPNSEGGDEITRAEIGDMCYAAHDNRVAKTSNSNARSIAGKIMDVRDGLVVVQVGNPPSPDGDLLAANNLSDVASAATARSNIGANKGFMTCFLPSLLAGTYYFPLPEGIAVTITKLRAVINQALGGADLVITPSINAAAITDGAVTVTQAGSAAGDQGEASPSAANVSDGANDVLKLVLSGNTTAGTGAVIVEYTF